MVVFMNRLKPDSNKTWRARPSRSRAVDFHFRLVASIWLAGPINLGLGGKEITLLVLTAIVSTLTFGAGRATVLQASHHLTLFAAFIFLAIVP